VPTNLSYWKYMLDSRIDSIWHKTTLLFMTFPIGALTCHRTIQLSHAKRAFAEFFQFGRYSTRSIRLFHKDIVLKKAHCISEAWLLSQFLSSQAPFLKLAGMFLPASIPGPSSIRGLILQFFAGLHGRWNKNWPGLSNLSKNDNLRDKRLSSSKILYRSREKILGMLLQQMVRI
jgi:hypothetical protein